MSNERQNLKTTLASIFERKGGAGTFTNRFDAFTEDEQRDFLENIRLLQDELPVVAGKTLTGEKIVITTDRILRLEGGSSELPLREIIGVTPDKFGVVEKLKLDTLVLKTKTMGDQKLITEPGPPYFGIWNMMMNVAARNR